eukprot:3235827-Ditylum_brightwellii.AAC.1
MVFVPKFSGGIGHAHVKAAHMSANICGVVKHVRTGTTTGQKFILMSRWVKLSAGIQVPIFEETRELKHLEGKWLFTLLKGMR